MNIIFCAAPADVESVLADVEGTPVCADSEITIYAVSPDPFTAILESVKIYETVEPKSEAIGKLATSGAGAVVPVVLLTIKRYPELFRVHELDGLTKLAG